MISFLTLMYLLSLALGYAKAFDCSTREIWDSVPNNDLPPPLKFALNPRWERMLLPSTCLASLFGIGYGFWKFGFLPGAGIALCFIVAAKIGEMFLLHKMQSAFHLNIVLRAVLRRQAEYMNAGEMERAKALGCLIEKVSLKLYALNAVRSATLVPAYTDKLEHLKVPGAKADNYQSCTRTRRGTDDGRQTTDDRR